MTWKTSEAAAGRDVKLENIFLTSRSLLKLGDFGLAMSLKQECPISPVGTLEYMAPEVMQPLQEAAELYRMPHVALDNKIG